MPKFPCPLGTRCRDLNGATWQTIDIPYEHMDQALLLLDNHVKNSHNYDHMPFLSCPLGSDCKKGHDNSVFFTTTGLPFPEAQQLLRNHIELSHPEVMVKMGQDLDQATKTVKKKRRAPEHPEHPSAEHRRHHSRGDDLFGHRGGQRHQAQARACS